MRRRHHVRDLSRGHARAPVRHAVARASVAGSRLRAGSDACPLVGAQRQPGRGALLGAGDRRVSGLSLVEGSSVGEASGGPARALGRWAKWPATAHVEGRWEAAHSTGAPQGGAASTDASAVDIRLTIFAAIDAATGALS